MVGSVLIQGAAEIIDKLFLGGILEFTVPIFTVKQNTSFSQKKEIQYMSIMCAHECYSHMYIF